MSADVPTGWRRRPVSEIARVVGGTTPSSTVPEYWGGDIPFVTPTDLTSLNSKNLTKTARTITQEGRDAAGVEILPPNSVLLATRASIGLAAINTVPVTTNQGFQNLLPLDGTESQWLYHAISARRLDLERLSAGTTFRELSRRSLQSFELLVPPREEQGAIACILDSIDDAIEKTEAVIGQTEHLRQGLLQELLTRGLPGRHDEWRQVRGVGMVPACWDVVPLGSLLREPIRNGFSAEGLQTPTGAWVLTLSAVTPSGFNPAGVKPVSEQDPRVLTTRLLEGDLLVSRSNTRDRVGLAGIYRGSPSVCSYPDLLMRIRPNERKTSTAFLEAALLSDAGRRYFYLQARGTSGSMVKIDRRILEKFPVPLPDKGEQGEILLVAGAMEGRIAAEHTVLKEMKDTKSIVSHLLLTGAVRIEAGVTD